jgi:hypothetical protein
MVIANKCYEKTVLPLIAKLIFFIEKEKMIIVLLKSNAPLFYFFLNDHLLFISLDNYHHLRVHAVTNSLVKNEL